MSLSSHAMSRALASAALLLGSGAVGASAAEPQPVAAACDVRKVDWKNFRYDAKTTLAKGAYEWSGGDDTLDGLRVELEDVSYADFDGDGRTEAHVRLGTRVYSDAPDSGRGVSIEYSIQLWVYEPDAKCLPRLLGTSSESYAGELRAVGNAYAVGSEAWGIVADKFRVLPRTHPLSKELRLAELQKSGTDQGGLINAFVRQVQTAHQAVERAAACLEQRASGYAVRAKDASAKGATWRKALAAAQSTLALAQKKKTDRTAWLRASEANVNALAVAWPAAEAEGSVAFTVEQAVGCHKGLDEQLASLRTAVSQAGTSRAQLAKTVAAIKAEKVSADQQAGWTGKLAEHDKLLAAWRTATTAVLARLTKAQRSGPPKQALAPKPTTTAAKPEATRAAGTRPSIDALSAVRATIQSGLESTATGAPVKINDATPGCNVRNVDWSNFQYTFGTNTYAARAGSARLHAWDEQDKLLPAEQADAERKKKAKGKKKRAGDEDDYGFPAEAYSIELDQVTYANLDGAPGEEAYVGVDETYSHFGGDPWVEDRVFVIDRDPQCLLRLRGSVSRASSTDEGSTKVVGKRVVVIDEAGDQRDWGFVKGAFVQLAGPPVASAQAE